MDKRDPKELLNKVVRVGGVIFSLVLGYLGALFSKQGFGELVPEFAWVGWVMACLTIYLEVMFSRDMKHDPLLWWAGIGAYIWGLGTNIIGWAGIFVVFQDPTAPLWRVVFSGALVIVLSFAVEVLPERLILLGLFGDAWLGDALSTMRRGHRGYTGDGHRTSVRKPSVRTKKRTVASNMRPVDVQMDRRTHPPDKVVQRTPNVQDKHKAVRSWIIQYARQNGQYPSSRLVAKNTPVEKSTAAVILAELKK